nr:hypothetical protein BHI3_25670 [Bacteriovorax sp. HI3]
MKKLLPFIIMLMPLGSYAETKLSADLTIDSLRFQRPVKGVGKAGTLIFKSANVNNNGIILNINNVNNFFDSQIFIRPTFLGFTTQFGNYGFTLEEGSLLGTINTLELTNSKLILDETQLNLAGEHVAYVDAENSINMKNFRLYCQTPVLEGTPGGNSTDIMANCASYLTLNGSYALANDTAILEYKGLNTLTGDKTTLKSNVKSFDIRKDKLSFKLDQTETVSNGTYIIKASQVVADCAKDPALKDLNIDKLQKDCLNKIKVAPMKANLIDNEAKSKFDLDIKDITVQDKIVYLSLNNGALSDPTSTTFINDMLLNCKKETDTDLLELNQVLKDCTTYARISIGEIKTTKPDDKKGSSIKKIAISSSAGDLIVQADVKILGFNSRVSIYGLVNFNETKNELVITVTDTKLPLGFTSVSMLMYFLKRSIISKDIKYNKNVITIAM